MKRPVSIFLLVMLFLSTAGLAGAAGPTVAGEAGVLEADMAPEMGTPGLPKKNTYADGQFTDVAPADWYSAGVKAVYELGLMYGQSEDCFNAPGEVSVAETVVLAARLHKLYHIGSSEFELGETWYGPYVSYGEENGIIAAGEEVLRVATRARFADILARALPPEALEQINAINMDAIPDVKSGDEYAESVYLLYRAGVLTGSGPRGIFSPDSGICRAEAAVILARMADKSLRQSFVPQYGGPDLTALKWRDDTFFAHSAILGNSLVEGLRMYSHIDSISYFSASSVSVISATKSRDTRLKNGSKGTLVQALCQEKYDKIYIELGINEMYCNTSHFAELYGDMIDQIKAAEPEADIYIISLLPVTRQEAETSPNRSMTRINGYNKALRELAEEKECYYMDVCSVFQGEDGYLPSGWSGDGVHPYGQHYALWENCMRTMY